MADADVARSGYVPLDLAEACHATRDDVETATHYPPAGAPRPPLHGGEHLYRGLPFRLGATDPSGEQRHLLLAPGAENISLPVHGAATYVLFAHRQLATSSPEGWSLGETVATYTFHLDGGQQVAMPIRERWEIHVVPTPWGLRQYVAVPDQNDGLWPRWNGDFNLFGISQQETWEGVAQSFHLWAWRNPHPELVLDRIELSPGPQPVLVGGVTLSTMDEHPFPREGRRVARIAVTDSALAAERFDLSVTVDRGVASWPHPLLPSIAPDAVPGFGHPARWETSPAYVDVAATPSATVTVHHGEKKVGAVRWGDVVRDGSATADQVRVELVEDGRNWVHVTVLDADTGRPVPCRVHFRSPAGVPYQPHGHPHHAFRGPRDGHANVTKVSTDIGGDVLLGDTTYAYIDGTCQGWLPRGPVEVEVARGFEYEPLHEVVHIARDQRDLTLRLQRTFDMNRRGWWSGDGHVHFLSGTGALFEQQAEDLNVVNLLQAQWGSQFTNTEDFTGRVLSADRGDYVTWVSQENRQHVLGHLALWGLREPVMPWSSDGSCEAEIGGALEVAMSHWADAGHAQGGTVVLPHFPSRNGEPAALIATGRADAIEFLRFSMAVHQEYYRYLNCGYRLPLVGGTDKMSNAWPVGQARTYAHIPEDTGFSFEAWSAAVRAGRTFYSSGPMIDLTVEGCEIGDTLVLDGGGTVEVQARCETILPVRSLQLVVNGDVVAEVSDAHGARDLRLHERLSIARDSWIAARCGGLPYSQPDRHHDDMGFAIMAHTSPVYVACGDKWSMYDPEVASYMLKLVDGGVTYIRETALRDSDERTTHHHGRPDHLGFLLTPWHEARHAITDRMARHR